MLGPALAAKLAQQSPDEAIEWAKGLGNKAATNAALAGVAKVLADTDPTRALDLLKEMGGSSDYTLLGTYRDIIEKLGLNNPDARSPWWGNSRRAACAIRFFPTSWAS